MDELVLLLLIVVVARKFLVNLHVCDLVHMQSCTIVVGYSSGDFLVYFSANSFSVCHY